MKYFDYLIVGSGLFGATFAYLACQKGKRCLVIEKRPHTGGNIYCETIEGINVHKYGAHIFHTSNKTVWDFVNSLVEFNRYTNCPIANYKGELYNLPFNMNTFYQLWKTKCPYEAKTIIERQRNQVLQRMKLNGISSPRNLEEQALLLVGNDIYEKLIKGYTEKQWGRPCTELPAFIIKRLPVRFVFDNNYFNDIYQGIPIGGYNTLIDKLLEKTEVRTETDFFENRQYWEHIANKIVYTGPIDKFYNYKFGSLEYRSVSFIQEIHDCTNYQGNAVINYTAHDVPYTRIIEHKHFEQFGSDIDISNKTVISKEYPSEWTLDKEPYYPINDDKNMHIYKKYKEISENEKNIIFGGRLAEYKYYDMDDTIEQVLKFFQ